MGYYHLASSRFRSPVSSWVLLILSLGRSAVLLTTHLLCRPCSQPLGYLFDIVTCCTPSQLPGKLLKGSCVQRGFGGVHASCHGFDLIFAGFDKGGDIEVAILIECFIRRLSQDCAGRRSFNAFCGAMEIIPMICRRRSLLALLRDRSDHVASNHHCVDQTVSEKMSCEEGFSW